MNPLPPLVPTTEAEVLGDILEKLSGAALATEKVLDLVANWILAALRFLAAVFVEAWRQVYG